MNSEQRTKSKEQRTKNKEQRIVSKGRQRTTILLIAHCSFLILFFFIFSLFSFPLLYAQDGTERPTDSVEESRYNTIKYGTETEIAALIQTLISEGADYLDNEIIALAQNTRNKQILGRAFAFFGEREKGGLEERAMRAIEERDEEENDTVNAAIDYLGRMKTAAASPVLRELLESGERRFMNAAFRSLGRVGSLGDEISDDTAEYLVDFYENGNPGDGNLREVILALGAAGSVRAVEFLSGIASDGEGRAALRIAALESLAKIAAASGTADGLDAVLGCLSSRDANIRSAAVGALGPFSGQAVDNAILDAFRDSYYRTRIAAAQASRQRKLAAAVPYLKFRIEQRDETPAVKEESIRALGAIANGEAMKVLEDLFYERKNSDWLRIAAGEMLMQNEPEKNLVNFIRELDDAQQRPGNRKDLYNGLLKIIAGTKCSGMEDIARRLLQNSGIVEKFSGLDIAANNNLRGLADDIKALAEDRNQSIARRARQTLEKFGM